MNADQLAQIVEAIQGLQVEAAAAGGNKKVSAFSSAIPTEWLVWKKHFQTVAQINGWNDLRQRREAIAAMEGKAGSLTKDIVAEPAGEEDFNINNLLTNMEARFLPLQETDLAVSQFETARQDHEETVVQWATRCRSLYERAYPDNNIKDRIFIRKFILGLADKDIVMRVHEQNPQTYQAASEQAQQMMASKQLVAASFANRRNDGGMHAIQGGKPHLKCFFCNGDHVQRDCSHYLEAQKKAKGELKERPKGEQKPPRRFFCRQNPKAGLNSMEAADDGDGDINEEVFEEELVGYCEDDDADQTPDGGNL